MSTTSNNTTSQKNKPIINKMLSTLAPIYERGKKITKNLPFSKDLQPYSREHQVSPAVQGHVGPKPKCMKTKRI